MLDGITNARINRFNSLYCPFEPNRIFPLIFLSINVFACFSGWSFLHREILDNFIVQSWNFRENMEKKKLFSITVRYSKKLRVKR